MKGKDKYPERKTIRWQGYDYSWVGLYFVTIVTRGRGNLFGKVVGDEMRLNDFGEIARREWVRTGEKRENILLDEFVVMPNHVHGIIIILNQPDVGATRGLPAKEISYRARHALPLRKDKGAKTGSLSAVVGAYKSAVTKYINQAQNTPGQSLWQRSYHDRVIRNDQELNAVREYIFNNPVNWLEDEEYFRGA